MILLCFCFLYIGKRWLCTNSKKIGWNIIGIGELHSSMYTSYCWYVYHTLFNVHILLLVRLSHTAQCTHLIVGMYITHSSMYTSYYWYVYHTLFNVHILLLVRISHTAQCTPLIVGTAQYTHLIVGTYMTHSSMYTSYCWHIYHE